MADLRTALHPGTILVSPSGNVRILRSRTVSDDGWNCSDGAAVGDREASDPEHWTAYSPAELAARLALATEVCDLGGFRELHGGLATWDACSGRPCVLPKLARLIR